MNADTVVQGIGSHLRPRTSDGWGTGTAMAFGVHLMLVAALALGVRWKISTPEAVEAEVWSAIPRAAVPDMAPPPPPRAEQARAAREEAPPKAEEPEKTPDIVVAPKPKKEPKKRKQREPVEVFENEPPKPAKKVEKVEKTPPKPVEAKPEPKPVDTKKAVQSKASSAESQSKAAAEREAQRQANLQRMMSDLGSLGTPSRSAGPSASYAGRIKARIKPNIVFTDNVGGNPLAVVEVRCGPDGRIISRKLIEPSGVASWDDAVLRAIERTEVLPADENGRVPPVMQIEFRLKDF